MGTKTTGKLKRDLVVSVVRGKRLVGVYWAGDNGRKILFETSPEKADEIIAIFNGIQSKKYYRIFGKCGVYLLTPREIDVALNRENQGVAGEILAENHYSEPKKTDKVTASLRRRLMCGKCASNPKYSMYDSCEHYKM